MKISSLTLLSLASAVGIAHGESDFNKLRSIINRLENDSQELTNACNDKDAEVTRLYEQLAACQQGCSSESPCSTSGTSADTDDSDDDTEELDSSWPDTTTEDRDGDEYSDEDDDVTDDYSTYTHEDPPSTTVDPTTTTTSDGDDTELDSSWPDTTTEDRDGDKYSDEDDDVTDDYSTYTHEDLPSTTVDTTTTTTSTSSDDAPSPGPYSSAWVPRVGNTWNYNLATPVDTDIDADVFAIDMDAGQDIIDQLHGKGKAVTCYISVGTAENWRDDYDDFPDSAVGNSWDDWEGEKWLDITNQGVKDIMAARVEKAAGMNCDAVEPDNMMAYAEENTGFDISEGDQIEYNMWFADTVHANGMRCAMKNAVELVPVIGSMYDFAINEECHEWDECGAYNDIFLEQGKPVFNVEYDTGLDICAESNAQGLDTIMKNYNLKSALCSCADPSRDMDCDDVQ